MLIGFHCSETTTRGALLWREAAEWSEPENRFLSCRCALTFSHDQDPKQTSLGSTRCHSRGLPRHSPHRADFRKDNGAALRQVCGRFVELCRRMGLLTTATTNSVTCRTEQQDHVGRGRNYCRQMSIRDELGCRASRIRHAVDRD